MKKIKSENKSLDDFFKSTKISTNDDKKKPDSKNKLNEFTGSEWATHSGSVVKYDGLRPKKHKIHGAAFPHALAEEHIKMYTKKGDTVLDPFVGVGTTLDVCARIGRNGIGFEINKNFVEIASKDLSQLKPASINENTVSFQKVINDNALNMLSYLEKDSIDFILTSPPYSNLLKNVMDKFAAKCEFKNGKPNRGRENAKPYSDNPDDFGNLDHQEFLKKIEKIFEYTFIVAKPDSYAAWIVKDFRDMKNGLPYINFHNQIIEAAIKNGWILWDIRIYDQSRFRPLVVLGYPSRNYYMNIGHSYILVFKKPGKRK